MEIAVRPCRTWVSREGGKTAWILSGRSGGMEILRRRSAVADAAGRAVRSSGKSSSGGPDSAGAAACVRPATAGLRCPCRKGEGIRLGKRYRGRRRTMMDRGSAWLVSPRRICRTDGNFRVSPPLSRKRLGASAFRGSLSARALRASVSRTARSSAVGPGAAVRCGGRRFSSESVAFFPTVDRATRSARSACAGSLIAVLESEPRSARNPAAKAAAPNLGAGVLPSSMRACRFPPASLVRAP